VICQERVSITTRVRVRVTRLPTTPERVPLKARWAPEHVAVEPADEGAGPGPGEEGDGHPLDVVEDGGAEVEDEALADAGGEPAGDDAEPASTTAMAAISRQPDDLVGLAAGVDGVDDAAGEDRGGDDEDGAGDAADEEPGEPAAVGAGEGGDPAEGDAGDRAALVVALLIRCS
jgi:hypothetical protein